MRRPDSPKPHFGLLGDYWRNTVKMGNPRFLHAVVRRLRRTPAEDHPPDLRPAGLCGSIRSRVLRPAAPASGRQELSGTKHKAAGEGGRSAPPDEVKPEGGATSSLHKGLSLDQSRSNRPASRWRSRQRARRYRRIDDPLCTWRCCPLQTPGLAA